MSNPEIKPAWTWLDGFAFDENSKNMRITTLVFFIIAVLIIGAIIAMLLVVPPPSQAIANSSSSGVTAPTIESESGLHDSHGDEVLQEHEKSMNDFIPHNPFEGNKGIPLFVEENIPVTESESDTKEKLEDQYNISAVDDDNFE